MKATLLRIALPVFFSMTASLQGRQPATPVYTQTLTYVKVTPGKGGEYVKLISDTNRKVAQLRANAGEILSWTLLRSVMPAGEEARADYLVSVISEGAPPAPLTRSEFENAMKKAGVAMTVDEYYTKRNSLSTLVASEMWRPRARVGAPKKGHYIFVDYMKVHDAAAYNEAEQAIWRPMHEERVKQGEMSGWIFATKMLPGGTETPYSAYTGNMYPTWQAAFGPRAESESVFNKVHPGKNYEETMANTPKLRSLARRELWVVVERVERSAAQTSSQ